MKCHGRFPGRWGGAKNVRFVLFRKRWSLEENNIGVWVSQWWTRELEELLKRQISKKKSALRKFRERTLTWTLSAHEYDRSRAHLSIVCVIGDGTPFTARVLLAPPEYVSNAETTYHRMRFWNQWCAVIWLCLLCSPRSHKKRLRMFICKATTDASASVVVIH